MSLYTTVIKNDTGVNGVVEVLSPTPATYAISSPLSASQGTNPEQLLAMSIATCLNASLHFVMKQHALAPKSSVEVQVDLYEDRVGYRFETVACVRVSGVSYEEAVHLLEEAKAQCPLHKLLQGQLQVNIVEEGIG